jgi:hypothetical protein
MSSRPSSAPPAPRPPRCAGRCKGLNEKVRHLEGERASDLQQSQQRERHHRLSAAPEDLMWELDSLRGQAKELEQKVERLEEAGCCAICLQAPLAAGRGFLHGDTVHR